MYTTPRLLLVAVACCSHGSLLADEPIDFGWISGHWCAASGDERIEEHWLSPAGGVLLGVARTVKGEEVSSFEYLRIVFEDSVPTYVAQPNGSPPTTFRRTTGGRDWARFENPTHDFPTRVEYRRQGEALHAEIAGAGEDGKEMVISFDYVRCPS
jgi:hypothetical protein